MNAVKSLKNAIAKRPLPLRIIAAVIAFAIIGWLLWAATDLLGNPVSYYKAKSAAEKYIAENYADKGYVLEGVSFNFKFKSYTAAAVIPDSEDCAFGMYFNYKGEFARDDYESRVANGGNTRSRIQERYRELINSVFNSPSYPYRVKDGSVVNIAYSELVFEGDDYDEEYDFGLSKAILEPDGVYDIAGLGEQAGLITLYVVTDELSAENAAEILLTVNELTKRGGAPFYAIRLTLESREREYYELGTVKRSEIYAEGLTERVEDAHRRETARLEELDKSIGEKPV
ncbi:MAG: hypothetical protein NC299_14390 [Lachnospiraceae bacterium]|nr:hypothetical protein [Ruminococcus sp.]MCM1276524.1 hypothetical protein [Lachnospiraceae bacterium]